MDLRLRALAAAGLASRFASSHFKGFDRCKSVEKLVDEDGVDWEEVVDLT